ncbi:hypothetical protein GL4_2912 [Methyloceanibacter caenitepidi]|uniref:Uncharacterized protein n=1 Tax=Methyloceanibacter caenitepidi TaxID=1384459 RepID=A0A0A8K609_9HYPH|nr:hypothetical protein GL4_2912 [Methyloceanibacter caenitepidi]
MTILQEDGHERVVAAAKPFIEGEKIKDRICRAAIALRRPYYFVEKAYYRKIGAYEYADLYNASLEWQDRRAAEFEKTASAEDRERLGLYVVRSEQPIQPISRAEIDLAKAIVKMRKAG